MRPRPWIPAGWLSLPLLVLAAVWPLAPALADPCADCHEGLHGQFFELAGGDKRPAWTDRAAFTGSVHGDAIGCKDCHRASGDFPHPPRGEDARAYRVEAAEACAHCHFKHARAARDGIHHTLHLQGVDEAPTCVDCHGAHAITPAKVPRTASVDRCGACHTEQAEAWRGSVHGKALLAGDPDAPSCADCHGAHAIPDPTDPRAQAASHTVCGRCHGDPDMMARHDLDPRVVKSYLKDFHGATNRIYTALNQAPSEPVASCASCHGFHKIDSFKGLSEDEAAARAADMCRDCHPGANDSFASAWGAHTPPSERHRPLVWLVNLFYMLLIPMMVLGLIAHILTDLWRMPGHGHAAGHGADHGHGALDPAAQEPPEAPL